MRTSVPNISRWHPVLVMLCCALSGVAVGQPQVTVVPCTLPDAEALRAAVTAFWELHTDIADLQVAPLSGLLQPGTACGPDAQSVTADTTALYLITADSKLLTTTVTEAENVDSQGRIWLSRNRPAVLAFWLSRATDRSGFDVREVACTSYPEPLCDPRIMSALQAGVAAPLVQSEAAALRAALAAAIPAEYVLPQPVSYDLRIISETETLSLILDDFTMSPLRTASGRVACARAADRAWSCKLQVHTIVQTLPGQSFTAHIPDSRITEAQTQTLVDLMLTIVDAPAEVTGVELDRDSTGYWMTVRQTSNTSWLTFDEELNLTGVDCSQSAKRLRSHHCRLVAAATPNRIARNVILMKLTAPVPILALSLCTLLAACQQDDNRADAPAATTAPANAAPAALTHDLVPLPGMEGQVPELTTKTTIRMQTSAGDLLVEVYPEAAPNAAQRFVDLVESGFYDATPISRVVPGFVAQFGINWRDPHKAWENNEFNDDPTLFALERGTLAFAKAGANTNSTQVFINYAENNRLAHPQYNFTVFGKVVDGMDVVDAFAEVGEPGGGLDQGRLWNDGEAYLESLTDKPTMIESATVVE
jgi:cyclophilin family peptidyl-prolyl cis-trans isomerase